MSFTPAFLEELRSRLPVSEVLGKRLRLTRAGREFKACCPFHNEKTPSFYINDDKHFYHCFGCGAHGDIIGFTMQHDRLSFPEAVETLAGMAGMEVPRDAPIDRQQFDREKRLYQLLDRATTYFEEQLFATPGREALNYLRGRGLSEDAIRRFRLGYAPNDGQSLIRKLISENYKIEEMLEVGLVKKSEERNETYSFFRNRVIFPVGDRKGRTVAFGGRVLGDGEPKYLNSPDHPLFHKGKLLYGLSRARAALSQNQPLIVVEGYMDVIALVEAGFSGAVAPLGTALTEDQLTVLWKLLPPFDTRDPSRDYSPILCFDGDNAGQRAAARAIERAIPLLTPAQTIRIATLQQGQDPDDLIKSGGKSAMDNVLNQAKPLIDMVWELSLANRRMQTPEDRGAFMAALRQRISRIGDETLRRLYGEDIRNRLDQAFGWRRNKEDHPQKRGFTPYKGKKGSWKNESAPVLTRIDRNPPPAAQRNREKGFLALMINHPDLFNEFGEEFTNIAFTVSAFEALKQQVTDILSLESAEPLDAAGLYRHLSTGGNAEMGYETGPASPWAGALTEILSESTYLHFSFARPGQSLDKVREGWKAIWGNMQKEQLRTDYEKARTYQKTHASEENLERVMRLREQLQNFAPEGDDNGFTEIAVTTGTAQEG